jgi:hypothetical protein
VDVAKGLSGLRDSKVSKGLQVKLVLKVSKACKGQLVKTGKVSVLA